MTHAHNRPARPGRPRQRRGPEWLGGKGGAAQRAKGYRPLTRL